MITFQHFDLSPDSYGQPGKKTLKMNFKRLDKISGIHRKAVRNHF